VGATPSAWPSKIAATLKEARPRPGRRSTTGYPPERSGVALCDPAVAKHGAIGIAPRYGRTHFARPGA
jgi:hypothetical protein